MPFLYWRELDDHFRHQDQGTAQYVLALFPAAPFFQKIFLAFRRYAIAAEFRRWVLDVFDKRNNKILPADEVDVRATMTEGLLVLSFPLHQQINRNVWSMVSEVYEVLREHIEGQIAHRALIGFPRELDLARTQFVVDNCDLGRALEQRQPVALEQINSAVVCNWSGHKIY
ncbi:hypothetical protein RGU75_00040 [Glaciimonas sp. CA11.2]|uniref:hypothetical protein n=2 Tax=Glaciimonas sp. CA11.2 TaxID=3048601 RepID=UPI002AB575FE|nr:hypothetical protein [Glaciimonas sp. CA11.2]MDY7544628.1 hypothetical protein [Glaciimonas sp. CA11.2]